MKHIALIMAGGSGKRFWPLSTADRPKQLLPLISEQPMIVDTVNRLLAVIPKENIFIATNVSQAAKIQSVLPEFSEDQFLIEPAFRDTAAAITYANYRLHERFGESVVTVLPSDHLFEPASAFCDALSQAYEMAKREAVTVLFGIQPYRADTNYGYLELGQSRIKNRMNRVMRFWEKPNKERAEQYLRAGNYLWNCGIFTFSTVHMQKEIERYLPKHHQVIQRIAQAGSFQEIQNYFSDFPRISIDFGVMEKTERIVAYPLELRWSDVGNFLSFEDLYEQDASQNTVVGTAFQGIESSGNIIYANNQQKITLVGIEDMVIVQTDDQLLICNKHELNKIKQIEQEGV